VRESLNRVPIKPLTLACTRRGVPKGFSIYYQTQENVKTPVDFPWAVFMGDQDKTYNAGGSAANAAVTVSDIEPLLGAWNTLPLIH
jgi:hypothetical protein